MVGLPLRQTARTISAVSNDLVSTPASTATRLPNFGKTVLNSSSTLAQVYVMEAPAPGVRKMIVMSAGSTLVSRTITGPSTVTFFANGTSQTNTNLVFQTANCLIELEGRTSLIWDVVVTTNATLS